MKIKLTEQEQGFIVEKGSESVDVLAKFNALVADIQAHNTRILALESASGGGAQIEGYLRVAGSSDPALSYRHYTIQEGVSSQESVFHVFYPCLVKNNLTGGNIGEINYVLKKLGATTDNGVAKWEDLEGNLHAIDGSEGDVMVVNIIPYYQIAGQFEIDNNKFDVFLRSRSPFTWKGIEAEEISPFGESPDYTVAHNDNGTMVMHSVYNPSWAGSYSTPYGVTGRYVITESGGNIVETFDSSTSVLGGSGGLHTTDLALYTGEQYAMNMQGGAITIPYYNKTARGAELLWAGLVAEGGTFDSHKKELFGSGFTSNDSANSDTYTASGSDARNGLRVYDKNNTAQYYSFASNVRFLTGLSEGTQYGAYCINSWRSPWHCLEAYRVICYAIENNISELTWFAFEGNKYKWRSITGYDGPAKGEATCVVFKMISTQASSSAVDPTDGVTSIAGNRIDIVVSTGLWHGINTQCSPLYQTSGLIFTEDEDGDYEAYMERIQSRLIISENGEISTSSNFTFETRYPHIMSLTYGNGYRKNYNNDAFMLPDTDANKSEGSLHTYVGGYNYFAGGKPAAGKKIARGFLRGDYAAHSGVSPLCVNASNAPSFSYSDCAFGTCCQIVTD